MPGPRPSTPPAPRSSPPSTPPATHTPLPAGPQDLRAPRPEPPGTPARCARGRSGRQGGGPAWATVGTAKPPDPLGGARPGGRGVRIRPPQGPSRPNQALGPHQAVRGAGGAWSLRRPHCTPTPRPPPPPGGLVPPPSKQPGLPEKPCMHMKRFAKFDSFQRRVLPLTSRKHN